MSCKLELQTERETDRETERALPPLCCPLPRWPQWPALSKAEARNQQLHLGFPNWVAGDKHSGHLSWLFPGHEQAAGSEVEQLELEPAITRDASFA